MKSPPEGFLTERRFPLQLAVRNEDVLSKRLNGPDLGLSAQVQKVRSQGARKDSPLRGDNCREVVVILLFGKFCVCSRDRLAGIASQIFARKTCGKTNPC